MATKPGMLHQAVRRLIEDIERKDLVSPYLDHQFEELTELVLGWCRMHRHEIVMIPPLPPLFPEHEPETGPFPFW